MKIDITSMFFNSKIEGKTATPAWRTSLGQSSLKECRIETDTPGVLDILTGMTYKAISDLSKLKMPNTSGELLECAIFDKVFVNGNLLSNCAFVLVILRESSTSHDGRMQLCYSPNLQYGNIDNAKSIDKIRNFIGCTPNGCWFVYDISILNQDELHFNTYVVDAEKPAIYKGTSQERSAIWKEYITKPSYSLQELGAILKYRYNHPTEEGQVAMIYAFVLEYGEHVVDIIKAKDLVVAASLTDSMTAEVTKAYNIYRYVKKHGLPNVIIKNHTQSYKTEPIELCKSTSPYSFVWDCIKIFNTYNNLRTLFESKYAEQRGGVLMSYMLINGCYAAALGKSQSRETIKMYNGDYINADFEARQVDKFADAVNDVFRGKYKIEIEQQGSQTIYKLIQLQIDSDYRPYITAIKSKPFLLLAGISGTGKSRIVRELARACWEADSEEYKAHKPSNFEMVQVKPNWHDSSELIGYVSRVSGEPVYVAGPFLKFVAKAWENPDVPYFLCLDEMNLAPVEQYFAEYLSVVESRKSEDGVVKTDPILPKSKEDWFRVLTAELTMNDALREQFLVDGICIPQNLIVVGTVNMDETTFSFSRKVLDRAMTIEMNEVDLTCGLDKKHEEIGKLDKTHLIGTAVEGCDVYNAYKADCDTAISYLKTINQHLEGTPFKVAYRTRNEFLLYVVNNLPYNKDKDGEDVQHGWLLARALDEITCMKVLSRIEGDETKVSKEFLSELTKEIKAQLESLGECTYTAIRAEENKENNVWYSKSLDKLNEMTKRLESGYTSFWS